MKKTPENKQQESSVNSEVKEPEYKGPQTNVSRLEMAIKSAFNVGSSDLKGRGLTIEYESGKNGQFRINFIDGSTLNGKLEHEEGASSPYGVRIVNPDSNQIKKLESYLGKKYFSYKSGLMNNQTLYWVGGAESDSKDGTKFDSEKKKLEALEKQGKIKNLKLI